MRQNCGGPPSLGSNGTATADSKFIGVVGDALVTTLRVTFSPDWEGYAKTLFMWDARGQNPVALLLGPDLLEDVLVAGVYLVKIPASPLSLAGDGVAIVFEGVKEQGVAPLLHRCYSDRLDGDPLLPPTSPSSGSSLPRYLETFFLFFSFLSQTVVEWYT